MQQTYCNKPIQERQPVPFNRSLCLPTENGHVIVIIWSPRVSRSNSSKAPFSVKTHCANSFFQMHYTNNETNTSSNTFSKNKKNKHNSSSYRITRFRITRSKIFQSQICNTTAICPTQHVNLPPSMECRHTWCLSLFKQMSKMKINMGNKCTGITNTLATSHSNITHRITHPVAYDTPMREGDTFLLLR